MKIIKVTPAKAGIQENSLGSGFYRGDVPGELFDTLSRGMT
jgi:hypothetical protein